MTYKKPRIKLASTFAALAVFATSIYVGITPSYAYAGTLENGNLAYAQSEFNKGSACDYLPGYEIGYDAWHLVLTTRGATFQADPSNPKVSINLNMVFMRTDGSKYVIKSGALVQFGKGAYVYTLTKDKDRIVQAGSLATINGSDSGMRLSHTCPGSGTATYVPTAQPSPTPSPTPSPIFTPTQSPTPVALTTPAPTPTTKFAGTLENGNLALADSEFNKGSSCDYLPGYETGYDAWHLVLTTRGSTFIQNPRNAKESIFLNILFQRADGSRYVITTGAWVQFGKGTYVYTPTSAQDRIVQAGTWAETNTTSSGMRLSHTCPGTKSAVVPATTPTPTPVATPTLTPVATPTPTPVATPTSAATPTVSPTPVLTPIPSIAPTPTPSTSKSERKNSCKLCTIKSFAKETPRPSESPGPASKKLEPSPTPSPEVTPTVSPTTTPTPTASPAPTAIPTASPRPTSPAPTPSSTATIPPTPTPAPTRTREPEPQLPVIPPVENPRTVVFVTPNEPVMVSSRELTGTPNTTIEIVKPPSFGTVEVRDNGSLVYTSTITEPTIVVVDVVEYRYTNLSGEVVIARKEFLVKQEGDVPLIIQTGEDRSILYAITFAGALAVAFIVLYIIRRLTLRRGYE